MPFYGQLLFALQVIAMGFCVFPLSMIWPNKLTWMLAALTGLSTVWVLSVNKLGNFSVFPKPKQGAELVTSGPYGLVRHPMYTCVILGGLTMLTHNQSIITLIAWIALMIVLRQKAKFEELYLLETFTSYEAYMQRIKWSFFPGIL